MVIIELAEDDAPVYEQQKQKKESNSPSRVNPEAASVKTDSPPVKGKDPDVQQSSEGPQPQNQDTLAADKQPKTEDPMGDRDEALMRTRSEATQSAKSKHKGESYAEGEGDGWETASEGSGEGHDGSYTDDAATSNEKVGTSSGNHEEHFEDALTEEQLKAKALALANAAKSEGNKFYGAGKYTEALECYANALEIVASDPSANELRAQCFSNRAICEINLKNFSAAVTESTNALELDPNYVKALMRRSQANENLEKFEEALSDMKKALELDPSNKIATASIIRLEPIVAKKREELKDEMIGKLKDLGNSVLGKFGMSVDDFKAVKDPNTGSYSISFGKS